MKFLAIFLTIALLGVMTYVVMDSRSEVTSLKNQFELMRAQQGQPHPVHPAFSSQPAYSNQPAPVAARGPTSPQDLEAALQESHRLSQELNQRAAATPPMPGGQPNYAQNLPGGPATTGTPWNSPPPLQPQAQPGMQAPAVAPAPAPAAPEPPPLSPRQRQVQAAPTIGNVLEYQKDHGFVILSAGTKFKVEAGMTFALRRGHSIVGRVTVREVDPEGSIADLDPRTVPTGVTVEVGDEVIQNFP